MWDWRFDVKKLMGNRYKILNLTINKNIDGLEILFAELTEIKDINVTQELEASMFRGEGEIFLIDPKSDFSKYLCTNPEENKIINKQDLTKITLQTPEGAQQAFAHSSFVKLKISSEIERRNWFFDLDFIFKKYLKECLGFGEFEDPSFASIFYQCKIQITKTTEIQYESKIRGFYNISKIIFEDGEAKTIDKKYPFMLDMNNDEILPEEITINPKYYTANEKSIKTAEGQIYYFPLLVRKLPS